MTPAWPVPLTLTFGAVAVHLAKLGRHLALLGLKAEASVALRLADKLAQTLPEHRTERLP